MAEESPGDVKYNQDRCKVLLENKALVDKYLKDGCHIDNVDSIQICGLEVSFYLHEQSQKFSIMQLTILCKLRNT